MFRYEARSNIENGTKHSARNGNLKTYGITSLTNNKALLTGVLSNGEKITFTFDDIYITEIKDK